MFHRLFRRGGEERPPVTPSEELALWIEDQIQSGVPRQTIYKCLTEMQNSSITDPERAAYEEAAKAMMAFMVNRNNQGAIFEITGKIERAIKEYEANLEDGFSGAYPYYRLCIIYEKRRDYKNTLRVCEAYLRLPYCQNQHKAQFVSAIQRIRKHDTALTVAATTGQLR